MKPKDNESINVDLDFNIQDTVTKTEFNFHNIDIPFIEPREIFPIGLDVGYSCTKIYSILGHHKFSSLVSEAKEKDASDVKFKNDFFIAYRDNDVTDKTWLVGDIVYESLTTKLDDEDTLFSKTRVKSDQNIILNRVGIALALMKKNKSFIKNTEILLSVGLPEEFDEYINEYKNQLVGFHKFEIQLGKNNTWIPISFEIKENNVEILSQPFGTLLSLAVNRQGEIINETLLQRSRMIIFDGGYGTVDTFVLQGGKIGDCYTWTNKAIKSIHEKIIEQLADETDRKIGLHELNYYLSLPKAHRYIKIGNVSWYIDDKLNALIPKMAKENIKNLILKYDDFNSIDLIIMTGGTSKIYYPYFITNIQNVEIRIAEMNNLENPDESFDCVYANVVGFFNFVVMNYRHRIKYSGTDTNINKEAALTNEKI